MCVPFRGIWVPWSEYFWQVKMGNNFSFEATMTIIAITTTTSKKVQVIVILMLLSHTGGTSYEPTKGVQLTQNGGCKSFIQKLKIISKYLKYEQWAGIILRYRFCLLHQVWDLWSNGKGNGLMKKRLWVRILCLDTRLIFLTSIWCENCIVVWKDHQK